MKPSSDRVDDDDAFLDQIPEVRVAGPERRRVLIEATVRILFRDGLEAVSHKEVSREAGLPITATTYYFSSLDTLISETFQALYTAHIEGPAFPYPADGDPLEGLLQSVFDHLTDKRRASQVLFELHLLAGRRPELKGFAEITWQIAIRELQADLGVSEITARTLLAVVDGYLVGAISTDHVPERAHLRRVLEAIIAGDSDRGAAAEKEGS